MKEDTRFGQLLDLVFKHRYGEDFEWEKVVVSKSNGNYVIGITQSQKRTIKSPRKSLNSSTAHTAGSQNSTPEEGKA